MLLRIELLSTLCSGSGLGSPGIVDRDVVFDRDGLPVLPGRRLKGLLRDAYQQARDCPSLAHLPPAETLFGASGDERPGPISVRDGHLEDAESIRVWLRRMNARDERTVLREDVIEFYAGVRRQTAMDRETGSPKKNTLRGTRSLRAGLVFHARLEGAPAGTHEALRYAASALQAMGTSRTRGLGQVQCSLQDEVAESPQVRSTDHEAAVAGGLCVLRFVAKLNQAALFPSLDGDPNTVLSMRSIPGSAVQGLLARRYLENQPGRCADARFFELFCSNKVRFLGANLRVRRGAGEPRRALPVPHSVREAKAEEGYFVDLAVKRVPDEPVRRFQKWFTGSCYEEVSTELRYHNARAGDPRIGRAVGEKYDEYQIKEEQAGALFTYESIAAGQEFEGAILGEAPDLKDLQALVLKDAKGLSLGRSRSAEYGGNISWQWKPMESADRLKPESAGWSHAETEADGETTQVIIQLLSPMTSVNESGHPVAEFPLEQLEKALDCSFPRDKIWAYVRTGWHGGYLSHQRLPRQQVPVLTAGSVFVLEAGSPIPVQRLQAAEWQSYGLRTEEGFGRIALVASVPENPALEPAGREVLSSRVAARDAGAPVEAFAEAIFRRRVLTAAAEGGAKWGQERARESMSNHVLNRVLFLVDKYGVPNATIELEKMKKPAKEQLGDLHGELVKACKDWEDLAKKLAASVYKSKASAWNNVFPLWANNIPVDPEFGKELVVRYLRQCLRRLLWRQRRPATEANAATSGGRV